MLYSHISINNVLRLSPTLLRHLQENRRLDSLVIHLINSLWCHITALSKNNWLLLKASGAEVTRKDAVSGCWQAAGGSGQRWCPDAPFMALFFSNTQAELAFRLSKSRHGLVGSARNCWTWTSICFLSTCKEVVTMYSNWTRFSSMGHLWKLKPFAHRLVSKYTWRFLWTNTACRVWWRTWYVSTGLFSMLRSQTLTER